MKTTNAAWSAGLAACLAMMAMMAMDALAVETTRYVVLVDGTKQAGHQVVTTGDDGVTHVDFIFKDNGRGPELKETFTLAPDHTLATYRVTGSSTFGAPVDESFNRQGGQATWKSTSDQGEQSVSGTAMYAPLGGSPAMASISLGALAKRSDGKLPLIPGGTLSARKITEVEVKRGQETQRVQLMALTGIGLVPQFVWATTDAQPRLFAAIVPGWMQLIEDGWNANAAALEERQKKAEA